MVESDSALNSQNGEQVLRSIQEWMVQQAHAAKTTNQALDIDNHASGKGSHFSPSIAPREPSIEASNSASPERPIDPSQQANIPPVASNRPFVGKRMVRTVVGGLLIAIVVAVAWQAYRDDQTRKLIKAWGYSSVIWLSSALGAKGRDAESAVEASTKLSDQATPAETSRPAKELAELQQQLQTVVNDLAVLRRNVEQLSSKQEQKSRDIATAQATEQNVGEKTSSLTQTVVNDLAVLQRNVEQLSSKQEQMSRDIATVQAAEQNASEKISSLTKSAPVHVPPRKNAPRVVQAETPRPPSAASVPPQTSPAGMGSPTDQPPRPPLPVPIPAETPSPVR